MERKMNPREEALLTLLDIEKNDKKSNIAIRETLMRHQFAPKRDRAFYMRLCEGVTERRIYLDYVLDRFSKRPVASCKPLIRNLLRLGAYQILFMDVRDAAACSEAVKLAKKRHFQSLSGFVNGVLRNVVRNKDSLPAPVREDDPVKYLSIIYSMPDWIVTLLISAYGEERTEKMLASFTEPRPLTVRTICSAIKPEDLKNILEKEGIRVSPGKIFEEAFSLSGINYPDSYRSFSQGYYYIQDESSMFPAAVAGIREGDTVLDLCAAPGGKTLQAADLLAGTGRVIARDLTEYKTELIRENVERIGFENVEIEERDALVFDSAMEGKADVVLADLPCSGLGVAGRKKDIRYRLKKEQLADLVKLQRDILKNAAAYVKPGGFLVFSTCTLNPTENEENVSWILDHTSLIPAPFDDRLPESVKERHGEEAAGGFIRLLPGMDPCDGFFVARFCRQA